jgi:hypothetical protein
MVVRETATGVGLLLYTVHTSYVLLLDCTEIMNYAARR